MAPLPGASAKRSKQRRSSRACSRTGTVAAQPGVTHCRGRRAGSALRGPSWPPSRQAPKHRPEESSQRPWSGR
eukprot:288379-Alexandrium_andersonii.AAC.1